MFAPKDFSVSSETSVKGLGLATVNVFLNSVENWFPNLSFHSATGFLTVLLASAQIDSILRLGNLRFKIDSSSFLINIFEHILYL